MGAAVVVDKGCTVACRACQEVGAPLQCLRQVAVVVHRVKHRGKVAWKDCKEVGVPLPLQRHQQPPRLPRQRGWGAVARWVRAQRVPVRPQVAMTQVAMAQVSMAHVSMAQRATGPAHPSSARPPRHASLTPASLLLLLLLVARALLARARKWRERTRTTQGFLRPSW